MSASTQRRLVLHDEIHAMLGWLRSKSVMGEPATLRDVVEYCRVRYSNPLNERITPWQVNPNHSASK